jgi:hypothetical protein
MMYLFVRKVLETANNTTRVDMFIDNTEIILKLALKRQISLDFLIYWVLGGKYVPVEIIPTKIHQNVSSFDPKKCSFD